MTSLALVDLILKSLTPSVNAPVESVHIQKDTIFLYNILSLSVVVVLSIHSSQFVIRPVIHPSKQLNN
jgi:hypothetical protein